MIPTVSTTPANMFARAGLATDTSFEQQRTDAEHLHDALTARGWVFSPSSWADLRWYWTPPEDVDATPVALTWIHMPV